MELTRCQEEGLRTAVARYKNKEPYTCIAGFAGTGKSTLISFIISALDLIPEIDVAYISFTGKASEVLRRKGCANAMTAHKLLYITSKTPNGGFVVRPRKHIGNYKLIVVDEVSMLPKKMWDLLLSHHIHVLACGDPGQLPPVENELANLPTVLDSPHIFLDEVMRQAADSDIIRLSMDIRENKSISYFRGQEAMVIPSWQVDEEIYEWADQILVGTNKKRTEINNAIRNMHGRGPLPEAGDKVISLTNHWDIFSKDGEANLVNGTIGYLTTDAKRLNLYYPTYSKNLPKSLPIYRAGFESDFNEDFGVLDLDYSSMTTGKYSLDNTQEYQLYKKIKSNPDWPELPLQFNYGYAITAHRAQGSEWNKVLIMEEKFPYEKDKHIRWLYTAVTRGSSRVILAR